MGNGPHDHELRMTDQEMSQSPGDAGELKTYEVGVPITGVAYITVEATDEESAIDKAVGEVTLADVEEWESHHIICRGNILYARKNEAEAREV